MSQPSVANYFSTRKRSAIDELKSSNAKKVLTIDGNTSESVLKRAQVTESSTKTIHSSDVVSNIVINVDNQKMNNIVMAKKSKKSRIKKIKGDSSQKDLQTFLSNMTPKELMEPTIVNITPETEILKEPVHRTPPSTPTKRINAMDKVKPIARELSFSELKQKICRSSRLDDLKASINKFKQLESKVQEVEKKPNKIAASPNLKTFKTLELEVALSPTKIHSPEKTYLSPKKDTTARKNLLNLLSPTKNAVALPSSPSKSNLLESSGESLTLPFKYRYLLELFRSIDIVVQIIYNRKETVTFKKLKPAVEQLLKRNLYEKHLSQIKFLYPDAFSFKQEKLREYGASIRQEKWELIIEPKLNQDIMSPDLILERRKKFFTILLNKVMVHHNEFLATLIPPLHILKDQLKRWHPEFNIENLPDLECDDLPQPPQEEKFVTGREILEKAKAMFNCNTRMEQALERLNQAKQNNLTADLNLPTKPDSLLKGIPKSLLEKVRQRQAAKALESMTRSTVKDKELQLYKRLPEVARLTRNVFVAEKKNVLRLETVLDKLRNSSCSYLTNSAIEHHLKTISKEVPDWLIFHDIRLCTYLKISKNSDLSAIINKLNILAKEKEN